MDKHSLPLAAAFENTYNNPLGTQSTRGTRAKLNNNLTRRLLANSKASAKKLSGTKRKRGTNNNNYPNSKKSRYNLPGLTSNILNEYQPIPSNLNEIRAGLPEDPFKNYRATNTRTTRRNREPSLPRANTTPRIVYTLPSAELTDIEKYAYIDDIYNNRFNPFKRFTIHYAESSNTRPIHAKTYGEEYGNMHIILYNRPHEFVIMFPNSWDAALRKWYRTHESAIKARRFKI